ncbi:competence type IV pilus minor pilin ComGF [Bacillaceae bacterium W0354]
MHNQNQKECVAMFQTLKKSNGYTLLSVLLSLTIFLIITPMTSYILKPLNTLNNYNYYQQYEMSQFKFFVKTELNKSKDIIIERDKIHFIHHDQTIVTFEKYTNLIRRRKNMTGHEVLLQGVKQLTIEQINENTFIIVITRGDGHEQRQVYFFKRKEEYSE